jgi:hypothetical protein
MNSEDVVQESLISKMQPDWMHSEDKRLSASLTAENLKLYPDHPKGKPFRVVFFGDERWLWENYYASIEEAHSAMNAFTK